MQVVHHTAGHHIVHGQSGSTGFFHYIIDTFPFSKCMKEWCKGTDVHGHSTPPQLMTGNAGKLIHQHPDNLCTGRYFYLQSFLHTQGTSMVVNMSRQIIHTARYIYKLAITQALAHFLNRAMNITQVWLHFFNSLTTQCNNQVQYTMCSRMLRTYINHHITSIWPGQLCSTII